MNAEVVYFHAYDIAQDADLELIEATMRETLEPFRFGRLKDAPRGFPVYHPLSIQIPAMQAEIGDEAVRLYPSVKIFPVGALSVKIRIPVSCTAIGDLLRYRNPVFSEGGTLEQRASLIARQVFERIRAGLAMPADTLSGPEVYTVYCVETPLQRDGDSHGWLEANRRHVAGLLVGESDAACLSDQEVHETLQYQYAYYRTDLVVVDWDAALVLDHPRDFNDTLYVMELANVQLDQLRAYDDMLDRALDKAYDDVERAARVFALGARSRVLKALREIRMDITKMADELSNISKFFGDWHLARVYLGCAERFHLGEWEKSVMQKLRTLDGLYTILQQDGNNRLMLILESAIVALFVIDLVIIVLLGKT